MIKRGLVCLLLAGLAWGQATGASPAAKSQPSSPDPSSALDSKPTSDATALFGKSFREIVRQQWNFGPPETIREAEDYRVQLSGVTVLELAITPDKNRGDARASIAQWRLAG